MATTADIRKGLCIAYGKDIFRVVDFLHVKPGKGPAFVRTKLRSLTTGKVLSSTFSAGHRIDEVRVETRAYQYLYADNCGFHFMHTGDYTQVYIDQKYVNHADLMKVGETVHITFNAADETPLSVVLPTTVRLKVTRSAPGVKGNTAAHATKPATLETGAEVQVPLFIEAGDFVEINTTDGSYSARVNKGG